MKELQKSLDDLKKCHKAVRKVLARIEDSVFEEFFGEFYSKKLQQDMKRYGDGHMIYGVPKDYQEIVAADAVILFAMTSPKLSANSDFNPTTPLHTIPYWHYGKALRSRVASIKSERDYNLHFLSWMQNVHIHGTDDPHAKRNHRLLVNNAPKLRTLFQQEKEASIEFVNHLKRSLFNEEKKMILITHYSRSRFDEPIVRLKSENQANHIKANLRGRNHQIMGRIRERLP